MLPKRKCQSCFFAKCAYLPYDRYVIVSPISFPAKRNIAKHIRMAVSQKYKDTLFFYNCPEI